MINKPNMFSSSKSSEIPEKMEFQWNKQHCSNCTSRDSCSHGKPEYTLTFLRDRITPHTPEQLGTIEARSRKALLRPINSYVKFASYLSISGERHEVKLIGSYFFRENGALLTINNYWRSLSVILNWPA